MKYLLYRSLQAEDCTLETKETAVRFWVMTIGGGLIGLLAGLLPLSMVQTYVRRFFPKMTGDRIERVRAVLVILGVAILVSNPFINRATITDLKRLFGSRSLTAEQQSHFVNTLKKGPKGTVDIQCGVDSAWSFSRQIDSLLKNAGWNVTVGRVEFNAPPQGIIIVVRSVENPPARVLQEAFKLVGFPPTYFGEAPPPDVLNAAVLSPSSGDAIWLIIGDKP